MPYLPTPPAPRINYEFDGTLVRWRFADTSWTTLVQSELESLNDDTFAQNIQKAAVTNTTQRQAILQWLFPRPRNILGIIFQWYFTVNNSSVLGGGVTLSISTDTTNGDDGVWTTVTSTLNNPSRTTNDEHRSNITDVNWANVKGLKWTVTFANTGTWTTYLHWVTNHLYGIETVNADGLEVWHPTLDQRAVAANLDFGDLAQATVTTKTLRLRNNSLQTANTVSLAAMSADGAMDEGLTFSVDNITFVAPLALGNIGPGITTALIYVRRTTVANEVLGAHGATLSATAASFS